MAMQRSVHKIKSWSLAPRPELGFAANRLKGPVSKKPEALESFVLATAASFALVRRFSSKPMRASSTDLPKNITVYYGNMAFWRAECVRMCLFLGGVPFEDCRDVKREQLRQEGKLTFGATPVMEVDGRILSQTQAMATYCSKLAGMHPSDPWEAAKVEEAINGCTDVTMTVGKTFGLPDDEKLSARAALITAEGRLTMHLKGLEAIAAEQGDSVVADSITVADLAIWRLCGWLSSGVIDGIPKDYVSTFQALSALCAKVGDHPKVQEWKAMHPELYK